VAAGRAQVEKELRREGATNANLDQLAAKLGFKQPEDLFAAVARDEVNLRQLRSALHGREAPDERAELPRKRKAPAAKGGVLVVGMDSLLTQLARCCKPVPPDPVRGFVTRGKGVSVHREDCAALKRLAEGQPERLIEEGAMGRREGSYAIEIAVTATDRRGLLRDVGDALATREDQRHGRTHAEPRRSCLHALQLRGRQHGAAEARAGAGAAGEGRDPGRTHLGSGASSLQPLDSRGSRAAPRRNRRGARVLSAAPQRPRGRVRVLRRGVPDRPARVREKLFVLAAAAALRGGRGSAFRPTRKAGLVLGLGFIAACWIFISPTRRMPAEGSRSMPWAWGLVAAGVAFSVLSYDELPRPQRRNGIGAATGATAFLGGANTSPCELRPRRRGEPGSSWSPSFWRGIIAGASLTLSIGVIGATLAAMVALQRGLHWYEAALLGLVPLAVRLPVPQRSAVAQAIVALVYALAAGGAACVLVWMR
jgi:hypothetical protein